MADKGMAGRLGRLNGRVTMWLARVAAAVLALLAVMTFCDVIARYSSIPHSVSRSRSPRSSWA
jgi:hypothetical protein